MDESDNKPDSPRSEAGRQSKSLLTLDEAVKMPTIDIPDAGRLFLGGLSRNASYAAARQGQIKTITVGRRKKALTKPLAEAVGVTVKF